MSNTNPLYYAWNGTSLETHAHGIEEFHEGRDPLPPLRGEDRIVQGADGRLFRPKVADSRVVVLTGWYQGTDDEGVIIDEVAWRYHVRAMRQSLWNPAAQGTLSKGIYTDASGTILRVSAGAQLTGGFQPRVEDGEIGLQIARFSYEFTLADPYYYDGSTPYL